MVFPVGLLHTSPNYVPRLYSVISCVLVIVPDFGKHRVSQGVQSHKLVALIVGKISFHYSAISPLRKDRGTPSYLQ